MRRSSSPHGSPAQLSRAECVWWRKSWFIDIHWIRKVQQRKLPYSGHWWTSFADSFSIVSLWLLSKDLELSCNRNAFSEKKSPNSIPVKCNVFCHLHVKAGLVLCFFSLFSTVIGSGFGGQERARRKTSRFRTWVIFGYIRCHISHIISKKMAHMSG